MKIVIACTSAGAGHLKAAQALYNYFQSQDHDPEIVLVDVLEESDFIFENFYSRAYSFMVNHAQWLWSLIFDLTSRKNLQNVLTRVRTLNNRINTGVFRNFLIQYKPEVIISTHYLPSNLASNLKKKGLISSKLVTVVTDFGVHPFWVYDRTDLYAVASEASRQELLKLGVQDGKIKVTGIPVDPKFSLEFNKNKLREKFGLDPEKFTVLVVTGSFGIGPIEEIIELLQGQVQVLAVCARNKRAFSRLSARNYPGVKVFGFVDNIDELMAISDLIVTKPGGLSISELLSMELVPVFISAIPGQESRNIEILSEYGIGEWAKNPGRVKEIVLDYLGSPQKLKIVKDRIAGMRKPFASQEIYRALR
jgi:processive 1,2-diacylglycerol beta-glucosyltransferase